MEAIGSRLSPGITAFVAGPLTSMIRKLTEVAAVTEVASDEVRGLELAVKISDVMKEVKKAKGTKDEALFKRILERVEEEYMEVNMRVGAKRRKIAEAKAAEEKKGLEKYEVGLYRQDILGKISAAEESEGSLDAPPEFRKIPDKQWKEASLKGMKQSAESDYLFMLKQGKKTSRDIGDHFEEIPHRMEESFQKSIRTIQGQLSALNIGGGRGGGGLLGGVSNLTAGLGGTGMKMPGILKGTMKGLMPFMEKIPAWGQALSGGIEVATSAVKIFKKLGIGKLFGGPKVRVNTQKKAYSFSESQIADQQTVVNQLENDITNKEMSGPEEERMMSRFDQESAMLSTMRRNAATTDTGQGSGSGSSAITSVTTVTEATANVMVGILETTRAQDAERNELLRDILSSNQNIEILTSLGSTDFIGFQGVS